MPKKREPIIVEGINHWHCHDCEQWLPETEFYVYKNGRVEIYCKKCSSIRRKRSYKKHGPRKLTPEQKEARRQYMKEYCANNKDRIKELSRDLYYRNQIKIHGESYVPREIRSPVIINDLVHWSCGQCKQLLPESEFSIRNTGRVNTICKSCKREYNKKYYEEHQEKMILYAREYYWTHRTQRLKAEKEWRQKNKERIKDYMYKYSQGYYKENKERVDARNIKYYYENKERFYIYTATRKNRMKNAIVSLSHEDWQDSLAFFDYKDAYTGLPMTTASQDHVIPLSKGGHYTRQNIIPCECSINKSKGVSDMETWYRKQPFYSEERLKKIYKWMGRNPESNVLQIALF